MRPQPISRTLLAAFSTLLAFAAAGRPAAGAPASALQATPTTSPSRVRDEATVTVDGVRETWQLVWRTPPLPACAAPDSSPEGPHDVMWYTCPCSGFAFGERGDLDLVRRRDGSEIERMALAPLFPEPFSDYGQTAIVRRVAPTDEDHAGGLEDPAIAVRAAARPAEPVMAIADYDHDGQASELLLQVDSLPCGKQMSVAIGVSRAEPRLHALRSLAHPEEPLVLRRDHWEALRDSAAPAQRVDWRCLDHGSETQTEVELRAKGGKISVRFREYACSDDGERGELVGERDG